MLGKKIVVQTESIKQFILLVWFLYSYPKNPEIT